jgi:hypothetical protein
MVNAGYYGRRVALYIAGVMFVSIVVTALALAGAFTALGIVPEGGRAVEEVTRFAVDYTLWLNAGMLAVAAALVGLGRRFTPGDQAEHDGGGGHDDHAHGDGGGMGPKRWAALLAAGVLAVGGLLSLLGMAGTSVANS